MPPHDLQGRHVDGADKDLPQVPRGGTQGVHTVPGMGCSLEEEAAVALGLKRGGNLQVLETRMAAAVEPTLVV